MKTRVVVSCVAACSLATFMPLLAMAQSANEMDRTEANVVTKDSAITSSIKARFAADEKHLGHVRVDTDDHGVVTLKGHVRTQDAEDRAVSIAKHTEGVREVKNSIEVKIDD